MFTKIIAKFAPFIITALVAAIGTLAVNKKFFTPETPKIDYSQVRSIVASELKKVPPPTVSVQPFEVEKIKGLREFVYSPQFTGSIEVAGVDSTSIRRMIDDAFKRYIEANLPQDKKRKR